MSFQLIKKARFDRVEIDLWQKDKQLFFTREQIGRALEYYDPKVAIAKLHNKHKERLDRFSWFTETVTPKNNKSQTYLYTVKGIYEICRWSRQPKANQFIDWVWDLVEKLRTKEIQHLKNFEMSPIKEELEQRKRQALAGSVQIDKKIFNLDDKGEKLWAQNLYLRSLLPVPHIPELEVDQDFELLDRPTIYTRFGVTSPRSTLGKHIKSILDQYQNDPSFAQKVIFERNGHTGLTSKYYKQIINLIEDELGIEALDVA